jgi:hypothetical protein
MRIHDATPDIRLRITGSNSLPRRVGLPEAMLGKILGVPPVSSEEFGNSKDPRLTSQHEVAKLLVA